jgi:glutathione synthase/RimK-type ligase-like ATP-grasp enzyme
LPQLARAAKAGFIIPQTVVSNSWQAIETLPTDKVIVKLAEMTVLYPQGKRKTLHTTVLNRDNLPKQVKPYPGIWQTFAPKQKEWRITVVGDKVFSAAIYTDESAKDDWRKHQDGPAVKFIAEDFPKSVSDLCVKFLQSYNLRYGAFDFIETPDNKMVYLEVNTAGQFAWIEDSLKLPISEAIAEELLRIAKNKN